MLRDDRAKKKFFHVRGIRDYREHDLSLSDFKSILFLLFLSRFSFVDSVWIRLDPFGFASIRFDRAIFARRSGNERPNDSLSFRVAPNPLLHPLFGISSDATSRKNRRRRVQE